MKIGYFGDGVWAHQALDRILESNDIQVVFIVARFDKPDTVLRKYAERLGIAFFLHENVNSSEFVRLVRDCTPDLNVSMSFNQILKEDILRSAPLGFINCHAGSLPFYRGRNILNWALIHGSTQFGVTVHHIDSGIDTGDIIVQKFAAITEADDYRTVLDKAVVLCAETLFEALTLIAKGRAPRILQSSIHPVGFYCSRRGPGDEWLDWSWNSSQVHNFVRAISPPGPGARTCVGGKETAILATRMIPQAPIYLDKAGTVVGRDSEGCVIKTGDSTIYVTSIADIRIDGAVDQRRRPSFPIGTSLGITPAVRMRELENRIKALENDLNTLRIKVDDRMR